MLLILLFVGVPLTIVFLLVGFVGTAIALTPSVAVSLLGETMYSSIASPTFTVLPLFVLMGSLAASSGFAEQAYKGIHRITARIPGSLAIATTYGSAAFAMICGSSLATASVFGRIAYPEMRRYHYNKRFSLGCIACSGSLAAMIPPSGMFILFSIFTGVPVGRLFIAGIIPGFLTASTFAIYILLRAKFRPEMAPILKEERDITVRERLSGFADLWQILLLGIVVVGGIYAGVFTATEAGAIGVLGTLVLGLANRPLRSLTVLRFALRDSAKITTTLFAIIIGALFFSRFLGITQIPFDITSFLAEWNVPRWLVLGVVLFIWFLMGMIIVPAAVFALTLPIIFPVMTNLGYDPVWFCVIAMKLSEMAGVTPPVGLNAFALASTAEDTRVGDVFLGVWPFVACEFVQLAVVMAVPEIALYLPNHMLG
jgi:tripartite ATP-independent transporter DctM subunit